MLNLSTEGNLGVFHTIQAEGKLIGYPSIFVRLSQCNLRCCWKNPDGSLTRCDTPHTSFNPEMNNKQTVGELVEEVIEGYDCKHIVVTGGEPFFQKDVVALINSLHDQGRHVTVETNGTIFRATRADLLSISVKLSSSAADPEKGKTHESQRLNYESLIAFVCSGADYQFKFVLNDPKDVEEIQEIRRVLLERCQIDISDKIWVMPQGICNEQLDSKMLWLVAVCKTYGWRLSDRMHLRIFGHQKGV